MSFYDGVLRAAARMIGGVPKFGHISDYMRDVLHWLPVQQRIHCRISSIVWHCVLGNALSYLLELFILTVEVNDLTNNEVPVLSKDVCLRERKIVRHKRIHGSNDTGHVCTLLLFSLPWTPSGSFATFERCSAGGCSHDWWCA